LLFICKYSTEVIKLYVHRSAYIGALSKHQVLLTNLPITDNSSASDNNDLMFYLSVYGGLAGANSFFTLIRAFLFAYAGIEAAVFLHSQLLVAILKVKCWSLYFANSVKFLTEICFICSSLFDVFL